MSEKEFTKPSNGLSRTIGDAKDMGIKLGLNANLWLLPSLWWPLSRVNHLFETCDWLRAVFKWLSKNQNQSNYSDQSLTGANSAMNQSQFLAIICNWLKAREESRVHGEIGFGFASHWLKNWCESFKPITKRSNRNYVITFDSHVKNALFLD